MKPVAPKLPFQQPEALESESYAVTQEQGEDPDPPSYVEGAYNIAPAPAETGGFQEGEGKGSFSQWASSMDTFVNPLTGQIEVMEDSLSALLDEDPNIMMDEILEEEMAMIMAQQQAALSQQAAIQSSAGLGTSGAFSSDIAGIRTQAGGAAASAHLKNRALLSDKLTAWRDDADARGLAIEQLKSQAEGEYGLALANIATYADNKLNQIHTPLAGEGWQVNNKFREDLTSLMSMIGSNDLSEASAQTLINSLFQQWIGSGLMFHQQKDGRYIYQGSSGWGSSTEVRPGEEFVSKKWEESVWGDGWSEPTWKAYGTDIDWD